MMKATVKQLATATFIALFLLVVNVKAEGTEKIASMNESIETKLQVENWMTDATIWHTKTCSNHEFYQETETGLEIENWMTNAKTWNFEFDFLRVTEDGLELESWMTSEETWNKNELNNEAALIIESWMTDSNIWK
jgi:hypothetical protein